MEFSIVNWQAWAAGLESSSDWLLWSEGKKALTSDLMLPKLTQIPAMQRRRLSPFAKITLHCALEAAGQYCHDVPAVFSSRHGDLNRTAELIKGVALKEVLSPTQFGLSVHNAVAGLFSIQMNNKQAITATSAGEATFIAGLIDAVAKLNANKLKRILYVYSDLKVPEIYQEFVSPLENSISIALLIESKHNTGEFFSLDAAAPVEMEAHFAPMSFMKFITNQQISETNFSAGRQVWRLQRHAS